MKTTIIVSALAVALLVVGYLMRPTEIPYTGVGPAENAPASGDPLGGSDDTSAQVPEADTPAEAATDPATETPVEDEDATEEN